MSDEVWTVHTDGAARGNPGPAAYAYVIARPGQPPLEHSEVLGTATNNVAEYTALVKVLEAAAGLGAKRLAVHSDSELMVKQINGEYRVKNEDLKTLYERAIELLKRFERVTVKHVRRAQNARADELCNEALDGRPARGAETAVAPPAWQDQALAVLRSAQAAWAGGANEPTIERVLEQVLGLARSASH